MSLLVYVLLMPVLTATLLSVNALFAVSRPDAQKVSSFECGLEALRGQTRAPFAISFYLVALLFLLFDLEVLLLYPLAVSLGTVGQLGFWTAAVFFSVLTLGFVCELGYGVLSFTDQRSSLSPTRQ